MYSSEWELFEENNEPGLDFKKMKGHFRIIFFDSFTLLLIGLRDKVISKHVNEFIQLMQKYHGIESTIYAICAQTFEVFQTEIPGVYGESKSKD